MSPLATFIANDNRTITDHAEITVISARYIKPGLPVVINVRHMFVAGDTLRSPGLAH